MKAVVDLATEAFRIPLYCEDKAFPIKFHRPMKYTSPLQTSAKMIPKPDLSIFQKDKRLAFENLETLDNFVTVIEIYNPNSGWLPVARDNATRVRAFAAVNVPPKTGFPGILKVGKGRQRGTSKEKSSNEKSISFASKSGAQGDIAHKNDKTVTPEAAGYTGPADPVNAPNNGGAVEGAELGHASVTRPGVENDSNSVNLYASTGSDES